jgi:predicted fused transcriptional regulator/phosphomethylpyrimidine kinase
MPERLAPTTASGSIAMNATVNKQVRLAGSVLDRKRHVCAFFNSKEEEYRVLMPFIKEGFDQGDRALHFIDPRNRAEHMRRLKQAGIDVAESERKDQLEIRLWEDAYLQEGHFDQHRQIALIDHLLNHGGARGYPLTRLVANMDWALEDKSGVDDIVEYESRLNYALDKHDDAVCCTYDVSRFSASVIMDALRVHPAVIIGGIYQENPFYLPPDEFLNELRERNASRSAPAR